MQHAQSLNLGHACGYVGHVGAARLLPLLEVADSKLAADAAGSSIIGKRSVLGTVKSAQPQPGPLQM